MAYVNNSKEIKSFTIISRACEQPDQGKWLIGQEGNHLSQGQAATLGHYTDRQQNKHRLLGQL